MSDLYDRLRPADEHLDTATADRVWARISRQLDTHTSHGETRHDHPDFSWDPTPAHRPRTRQLAGLLAAAAVVVGLVATTAVVSTRAGDTTTSAPTADTADSGGQQAPPPASHPAGTDNPTTTFIDYDVDALIYDDVGMPREMRTGTPLQPPAVLPTLEPVRHQFGDIQVGDRFDTDFELSRAEVNDLAFIPVTRWINGQTYLIGWVDQIAMNTAVDGLDNIAFVYNDDGMAIGSLPFPAELPDAFPLPANLEPLRHLANEDPLAD